MVLMVLIIFFIGYLIYKVIFEIPRDIKKLGDKIYMLKLHQQEIELKLNQLDKKQDNK